MDIKEILEGAPPDLEIQKSYVTTNLKLRGCKKAICAISGGADSDIVIDMLERIGTGGKVDYVFFNTGLESQATKDHIKLLEERYGVKIREAKAKKTIPVCVKEYGVPFLSKQVSEFIERLQRHNFKWEDKPFEELIKEYPECKAALRWWCNKFDGKGKFNISRNKYLKEFLIAYPPPMKISNKCCKFAKKDVAKAEKEKGKYDLSITGIRKAEGGARSTAYRSCFTPIDEKHDIAEFRPVFWFKKDTKTLYEKWYVVIHSDCYRVWKLPRTGCSGCPFAKDFETELAAFKKYEPKLYNAIIKIFGESYEYTRKYREFQKAQNERLKANDI